MITSFLEKDNLISTRNISAKNHRIFKKSFNFSDIIVNEMKPSLATLLARVMQFVLIGIFIYLIFKGNLLFILAGGAVIVSFLPAILQRSYKVNLPWGLEALIAISLLLDIAGSAFGIYHRTVGYDWFAHFFGIGIIGILAFMIVSSLDFIGEVKLSIRMIGFFTLVFALAVGALYEMAEYLWDTLLRTNAQISLDNTMQDLFFDLLGGGAVALFGMAYLKRKSRVPRRKLFREYRPFILLADFINLKKRKWQWRWRKFRKLD